jgi:RimJ/RimL family protein N-acetyltransferase
MIEGLRPQTTFGLLGQAGVTLTTQKRRAVTVRQGISEDADLLIDMWRRLSARTVQLRFGRPKANIHEEVFRNEMAHVLNSDPRTATTLIGMVDDSDGSSAVSLVQIVQHPDDRSLAEIAIVVRDDYQREGLGRALCGLIKQVALLRGIRTLQIHTLAENIAVMRLIRGLGMRFTAQTIRGETEILLPLADR